MRSFQRVPVLKSVAAEDDDDDDEDIFASLIQKRDDRRESIKKKADMLMSAFGLDDSADEEVDDGEEVAEIEAIEEVEVEVEEEEVVEDEEEEEEYEVNDDDNYADDESSMTTREVFDKLFDLADADRSGGIDVDEFGQLYRMIRVVSGESDFSSKALSMTPAEEEEKINSIFASMDDDASGTVELAELKAWLSSEEVETLWPDLHEELTTWELQ